MSPEEMLPKASVSRLIEYFPPGGNTTTARDCTYAGRSYSKGAVVTMGDGKDYQCSADAQGTWKPVKKS